MKVNIQRLIVSISLPFVAGVIGSVFTTGSIDTWYTSLEKPAFNPPNWLFGPVWAVLYTIMGVALYLVWQQGFKKNLFAIKLFFAQLLLNTLWSIFFFGLKNPLLALIEIVILWIAIYLTLKAFYKIEKNAGLLLIPYLLWVAFALVLNFSIVLLN